MTPAPDIFVGHVIDDDSYAEYQALKSLAQKILQAQDNGVFGLVGERDRILTQLRQVYRKESST